MGERERNRENRGLRRKERGEAWSYHTFTNEKLDIKKARKLTLLSDKIDIFER